MKINALDEFLDINFTGYSQSQQIEKTNNLKVFGSMLEYHGWHLLYILYIYIRCQQVRIAIINYGHHCFLSHEYPSQFQQLKTFISTTQAHDYQLQNLCHIWPRICSVCRNHDIVLSFHIGIYWPNFLKVGMFILLFFCLVRLDVETILDISNTYCRCSKKCLKIPKG
jgi:hypothetical protein